MKAIGLTKFGPPDVLTVLKLPKPTPQPKDILVQIKAISTNPLDTKVRIGRKGGEVSDNKPWIPGYDASGIVVETGSQVTKFKKGDEVYYSGVISRPGTYAHFNTVDERLAAIKPKSLDWAQSAALPLVSLTAWEGLVDRMDLPPNRNYNRGYTLLIVAGAGGMGSMSV